MKPFHLQYSKTADKMPKASHLYMKLRSRLSLYFFVLIILPFAITTIMVNIHMQKLMEEKTYESSLASIIQEKNSIKKYIGELEMALNASPTALPAASQVALARTNEIEKQSFPLKEMIRKILSPAQEKALSSVYFLNRTGITASYGPDSDQAAISNPTSQQWFFEAVKNPDSVLILGTVQRFYAEGLNKAVLCAAKAFNTGTETNSQVVLLFDFNYSLLTDALYVEEIAKGSSSERQIIDFEGNLLFCRNQGQLTAKADGSILNAIDNADSEFKRIHYRGDEYYMTYLRYPDFKWTFIALNPVSNVVGSIWTRSPFMMFFIILLPVLLLIYLGVSLKLIRPINELTSVISDYENQFPGGSIQTPILRGKTDDMGINRSSDVDFLINKIYSIRLSQKEAELNSLQNQINPHFLYNTLESIRGAALYHGINDIAAMSKALSLLFRYSISERVLVTIKEELQHLENYISIQNFRYENKFELLYSIPPELMNYKVLKLTLQPLIENSIKHGLEMKLGKGAIRIEILVLDNNIKIQISDNGLGIPSKKLEELNKALYNQKFQTGTDGDHSGTGIGVMNVNSRIKLYFGEQYGLKFREALIGTTVEITLPAVKEN